MKRASREEQERYVAAYRRSGLTQAEFARRHRIKIGTLQSWIYRPSRRLPKAGRGPDDGVRFAEVEAVAMRAMEGATVLHIGEHLVLELGEAPTPAFLVELADALSC